MENKAEYKKIYIQESAELLQAMNVSLLALEKKDTDIEALNSIFRSAHTLKSMSASMGYSQISDLAHKMEDVLDKIRSGKVKINDNIINLLFQAFDMFEVMAGQVEEERTIECDISPIVNSFNEITGSPVAIPEEIISTELSLNVFEKRTLVKAKKEGYKIYQIKVLLEKQCILKSVRAFMVFRNLHSIGEVVKSMPDSRIIEEEKFDREFACVFVTFETPDFVENKVKEVLEIESARVEEITVEDSWDADLPENIISKSRPEEQMAQQIDHLRKMQSVRVDIKRLDKLMNLVEELAIEKLRLTGISETLQNNELKGVVESLNRLTDDLQAEVMQARLVPVGQIFERFPRLVRDLAKKEGKEVALEITGGDIELDRLVLDEIGEPLIHLLRNSVDHGLEEPAYREKHGKPRQGKVSLVARREKSHVFISVEDDGFGLDVELIRKKAVEKGLVNKDVSGQMKDEEVFLLAALPGFSTKEKVTDVSGRGVGLDVAKRKVEDLGGGILIESKKGEYSRITLRLPLTTAVVQALMVYSAGRTFAVPISSVIEIITAGGEDIKKVEKQETVVSRGRVLPMVRLDKLFADNPELRTPNSELKTPNSKLNILIVEYNNRQFGVAVDKLLRQQDIVIKQLTKELKGIRGFAGATILGDGNVALVLDVATLV